MVKVKLLFKIIVIFCLCDFVFTQPEDVTSTEADDIDPTKQSASIGSNESSEDNKIDVTTAKIASRFNSKSDDDNVDEDEIATLVRSNLNPFSQAPSVPPVPMVKVKQEVNKKPTKNIKKKVSRGYNYPKPDIPFEFESSTAAASNNKPNTFGGYHYPKPAKPFTYPNKA